MTFTVTPPALVSTYCSTGVPSGVFPNAIFVTPALPRAAPAFPWASAAGEQAQSAATATSPAYRCMVRLLVARDGGIVAAGPQNARGGARPVRGLAGRAGDQPACTAPPSRSKRTRAPPRDRAA